MHKAGDRVFVNGMKITIGRPVNEISGYKVYVQSCHLCGDLNEDIEFGPFEDLKEVISLLSTLEEMDNLLLDDYHCVYGFNKWFNGDTAWPENSYVSGYYARFFKNGAEYKVEVEEE